MKFFEFNELLKKHVDSMTKDTAYLYVVDVDKDLMWNTYLDAFPAGTNEIFRKLREFDCSCCRHFIKSFGNVVSIKDNKVTTIWDFVTNDTTFQPVIDALSVFIKSKVVTDYFITKFNKIGTVKSHEQTEDGKIITWDHFNVELPKSLVDKSSDSEGSIMGRLRDVRNVFKRSLDEISEDSVQTVLELISQKSLYKGEEWEAVLKQFLKYHKEYRKLKKEYKENFCWEKASIAGPVIGKLKNHSIGTLLIDITNGVDINEAVRKYEAIVAPSNYKRPKAIFTKKMLDDAKQKLEDLGLVDSLGRRYATLEDITVNNILFVNRDDAKKLSGGSVFDDMTKEIAVNPKSFDKVEQVSIETFVNDILPTTNKLDIMFENKHVPNMVSLIAPSIKDSKTLFKWDNGFSWAYSGNITDSMKERVKAAGGKVDGVLRFSIQWNEDGNNHNDFDAHCKEPMGNHIYFGSKRGHISGGELDVDIIFPDKQVAVENITWSKKSSMQRGKYLFYVHNFSNRGGRDGFTAEIEFEGQIYSFAYNKELRQGEVVNVAEVMLNGNGDFTIKELIPSNVSSRKIWNIDTNQFHPVSICMYSPNYWDKQDGIGHKHYFFMLKNCINDESPNGFFNEFLKEELMEHKRVFEALGSKMKVEDSDHQLSGIGFSSTKHSSFICKVEGRITRTLNVIL